MSDNKFTQAIKSAQAEMATWSDEKRASVQLEGTDKYLEQARRLKKTGDQGEDLWQENHNTEQRSS